ncbi:GrpB family protein [Isoptericola sp. NPDC057559]|uniref:GrpB family protein n=1 Tax=Isoptericola sp. NPDC057559 TaxID=3346168 RepID=UPI0036BD1EE0
MSDDRDVELVGGVERREIVLVEPDPAWPARFARERERIAAALGPVAVRVDHVGSTSVPGLAAKPIVDIDVSVPDVEDEDAYLPALLAAGYLLRVREPGHRLVRTPDLGVHVHVCSAGSDWERLHLLFRDRLRHDADDRAAYAALKRELAAREWPSMNHYAEAKGELIAEITARAEAWASATGWRVADADHGPS